MQGKYNRVIDVLKKIAYINKKPLPDLHLNIQTEVIFKRIQYTIAYMLYANSPSMIVRNNFGYY